MIWKHGLYAAENTEAYEIVEVKKVRRSYEIDSEGEPLLFITAADVSKLGINKRETLPVEEEFDGILYSLSQMDISKLKRQNEESKPKKWSRFLNEYVRRLTLFQVTSALSQFRSDDDNIEAFFEITKSANNKVDSPHFRDGKIVLPTVNSNDKGRTYLIIDIPNRVLMVWEEVGKGKKAEIENVDRFELGIGRIGQFKHLKWPRPNREGQQLVNQCLIWTHEVPEK